MKLFRFEFESGDVKFVGAEDLFEAVQAVGDIPLTEQNEDFGDVVEVFYVDELEVVKL